MKYKNKIFFVLILCAIPMMANAIDVNSMMDNLRQNFPAIYRLIYAMSFLLGCWCIYASIHKLRAYGEVRTMMPSNTDFSGPMAQFFVGILLIFLPSMLRISVSTFWGSGSILQYTPHSVDFADVEKAVVGIIRIFGLVAFIRGLMLMQKAAQKGGAQPGTFGKGMIHLIGGILAINVVGTINVIKASLGFLT